MRKRLYFLLPDLKSAEKTTQDLLLDRVEERHIHFLAKRGTKIGKLHEANIFQKTDLIHSVIVGLMAGGVVGVAIGVLATFLPPLGTWSHYGMILVMTVGGAMFGVWASSLVGVSIPNSALKPFEAEVEKGKILMMVDVPKSKVEAIEKSIEHKHPEAKFSGMEPSLPVFP